MGVRPHAALRFARLPLGVFVAVAVGGDRVPLPHEPTPNVSAVAGYGTEKAPEPVYTLDRDADAFAADFLNECALHVLVLIAVLMLGLLIPFGRIKPGNLYFPLRYPYLVAVGNISLARNCAGGNLDLTTGLALRDA